MQPVGGGAIAPPSRDTVGAGSLMRAVATDADFIVESDELPSAFLGL